MGAIAPTAKKVVGVMPPSGGDAPKSPHRNFVMSPLCTAKRYSKKYDYVIMKVKKVSCFQPENAPIAFGGRASPGSAERAYSAP